LCVTVSVETGRALRRHSSSETRSYRFDGSRAEKLRPVTLAWLDPVNDNPNFGPTNSIAEVKIRRCGQVLVLRAPRVVRTGWLRTAQWNTRGPISFTFGCSRSSLLNPPRLKQLWNKVVQRRGLILDLRNCVGRGLQGYHLHCRFATWAGKASVSDDTAGWKGNCGLYGFRTSQVRASRGTDNELQHRKPTRSPVGHLQRVRVRAHHRRAHCGCFQRMDRSDRITGEVRSFCRSLHAVSFAQADRKGRGIEPTEVAINTGADFEARRDRALTAALRYVSGYRAIGSLQCASEFVDDVLGIAEDRCRVG